MEDGERRRFEATCLPLLGDCHAFALSLARDLHDAEDLVQETFLKAQRAFSSYAPDTNAKAWLFTILRRVFIDQHRRRRRRPLLVGDEALAEYAAPPVQEGGSFEDWSGITPKALEEAVNAVPDPFRLPLRLRDLDGFSYREIGEILAIPAGTVMSRLHRGREYLKRLLVPPSAPPAAPADPGDR